MDQPTFSDLEYQGKKRKTRRELFLERMDGLIPWQLLGGGPERTELRTFRWEVLL